MLLRFLSAIEFITGSESLVIRSCEGAYGDTPQRKFPFQETIVET
jgi:hypothetical protein